MNKKEMALAKKRILQQDTFIADKLLPHVDFEASYAQRDAYESFDARKDIPLAFQMGADLVAVSCYRKGYYDILITQALYRGLADPQCDSLEEAMGRFKLLCDAHFKMQCTNRYVCKETADAVAASRIGVFVSPRTGNDIAFACVREGDVDDFLLARLWQYIVPPFPKDPATLENPRMRELVARYASHYTAVVRKDIAFKPF